MRNSWVVSHLDLGRDEHLIANHPLQREQSDPGLSNRPPGASWQRRGSFLPSHQAQGSNGGISAETASRCNHAMQTGVAAKRLRGRIQKGSPMVLAPAVRDSPCQLPATAGGPSHAMPFSGEGGRDGGDRSRIHARRRVAEYGNVNVDGEPGQVQEESRLPKAASARSRVKS